MQTPHTPQHRNFCDAIAKGSTQGEAYKQHVAKRDNGEVLTSRKTCDNNGYKLAEKYQLYIESQKKDYQEAIKAANFSHAAQTALQGLLSHAEILQMLSDGARGILPVIRLMFVDGKPQNVNTKPDLKERLACLDRYMEIMPKDKDNTPTFQFKTNTATDNFLTDADADIEN
jgi:hypothetical protein